MRSWQPHWSCPQSQFRRQSSQTVAERSTISTTRSSSCSNSSGAARSVVRPLISAGMWWQERVCHTSTCLCECTGGGIVMKCGSTVGVIAVQRISQLSSHDLLSTLLYISTSLSFSFLVSVMATSQGNLHIPPPNTNTNRDSHIDLGLIGRGLSPDIQEFNGHSRIPSTTTNKRIGARDTSAHKAWLRMWTHFSHDSRT